MAIEGYKKALESLLETYVSLGDSADTVVRFLKKKANVETRSKLIAELRSLDQKCLEILDQLDGLAKPT
jgi:hypothetical protein